MPILKLSDATMRTEYRSYGSKFDDLIKNLGDSKWNWQDKTMTRTMIPVSADVPQHNDGFQQNYIEYLTTCWANHYSVVIEPNNVWYTLLCELATKVKADPETYRDLFTKSSEKQTVIVPYDGGGFTISLDLLMAELRKVVPTDTDAFFPEFSTNTYRNRMAKYAAFADMASPYYNYMMFACGFPAIDVRGERDDWKLMAEKWRGLGKLFGPHSDWFARVQGILNNCVENHGNPEWWKGIYRNERCGSGGDVLVAGWFADLFYEKCSLPKPENFPSCVASFDYTRVNLHDVDNVMQFRMKHGLFANALQDEFLVPEFGHLLFNVADDPITYAPEMQATKYSGEVPVYRLEPENMVNSKKMYDQAREAVKKAREESPEKLGPYRNTAQ